MFFSAVLGLGIMVALAGLGFLIGRVISPNIASVPLLSVAYPLGAGLFTFLLFLLSWIDMSLTPTTVVVSYLLCVLLVVLYGVRIHTNLDPGERTAQYPATSQGAAWGERIAYLSILGLMLLAAYLSFNRGYSSWDAIGIWGVKGIGIAQEGTVFAASRWGSHGLSYPLNIPLQIALFRILGEGLWTGSKLIFPLYFLSLLLGIFTFLKRSSGWKVGLVGTLLLATTPILFEHGTIGYANLPFTTYLALGLLTLVQGWRAGDSHNQFIGGILLGLASWTRPEGALLIVPILVVVALGMRGRTKPQIPGRKTWWLPPLLLIGIWQVFLLLYDAGGLLAEALRSAWTSVRGGDLNLSAIYWTARYTVRQGIDPDVWGFVVPVGLLFVLTRWREVFSRKNQAMMFLLFPALVAGLSIFAYYYLASFQQDIQYLLGTSVNRLFMPVWVLGFLGILGAYAGERGMDHEHRDKNHLG